MILETDASNAQLGVQLLQEEEGKTVRPVGFWSRQCNKAESNYSATEKEALAVVWGIRICRPHL
jgi:RNase H-like domain found in reverse transcriptase